MKRFYFFIALMICVYLFQVVYDEYGDANRLYKYIPIIALLSYGIGQWSMKYGDDEKNQKPKI